MTAHAYGIRSQGYRLPDGTHPGAVRLLVSDLARSVRYYEQILGLTVVARTGSAASLAPQGSARPLVELETRPGTRPSEPRAALGLYHFALLLPSREDLGRFLQHLSSLGARAGMADHFVSEAVYLTDPDGLGIEVYADRPRDAWKQNGRELVMTTEPLDAAGLVAAAAGTAWQGLPAGTVMGHVHLHVGDIDEAAAFYHAALGFDKVVWSYPGALFMSAGGYHHHLGTNTWSHGPRPAADQARLLSWDLIVPREEDARAAARSLAAGGYSTEEASGAFLAADPWGTALRITAAANS